MSTENIRKKKVPETNLIDQDAHVRVLPGQLSETAEIDTEKAAVSIKHEKVLLLEQVCFKTSKTHSD